MDNKGPNCRIIFLTCVSIERGNIKLFINSMDPILLCKKDVLDLTYDVFIKVDWKERVEVKDTRYTLQIKAFQGPVVCIGGKLLILQENKSYTITIDLEKKRVINIK